MFFGKCHYFFDNVSVHIYFNNDRICIGKDFIAFFLKKVKYRHKIGSL